jgi:paraquat-inducible protein B
VIPVTVAINAGDLGKQPEDQNQSVLQPLVERGLRAQLKTQSLLTGLLYVDFDFLPGSKPRYVEYPSELPQIPTAPTELEAILRRVSDIDIQSFLQNANATLNAVNVLLTDPETRASPGNVNATLAELRTLSGNLNREVAQLSDQLAMLVSTTRVSVDGVRGDFAQLNQRIGTTLSTLDATLVAVQRTADGATVALSDESPLLYELQRSAVELRRAARSLQGLAAGVEREPESLVRGKRVAKEHR